MESSFLSFFFFYSLIRYEIPLTRESEPTRVPPLISKCPRDAYLETTWRHARRRTCLTRKKNNSIMPTPATLLSQWLPCFIRTSFSSRSQLFRFVSGVDAFFFSLDHINLRLDYAAQTQSNYSQLNLTRALSIDVNFALEFPRNFVFFYIRNNIDNTCNRSERNEILPPIFDRNPVR